MTITRSRKIAGSTALRRVKPNAKRKERKTQKRKSRNKVMKGGVHPSLKVYVIQKKLGRPKCVIIKVERMARKDDIFLFFDATVTQYEINTFVCAAMGAESTAHITPEFHINPREGEAVHNRFIKLSGFKSYSIESGVFRGDRTSISNAYFDKKHKIDTNPKIEKWEDVIANLTRETETKKKDYTFTPFDDETIMANGEITKNTIVSVLNGDVGKTLSDIKKQCENKQILLDIRELIRIIQTRLHIKTVMDNSALSFASRSSAITDKDEHKQATISEIKQRYPNWDTEISTVKERIQKIKDDSSLNICRNAISDDEKGTVDPYLNIGNIGSFQSIKDMADAAYNSRRYSV